jgi:hypothetical protein
MNRERHNREIISNLRFNLLMIFLVSVINWICIVREDLGLRSFLLGFNATVWIGMMIIIIFIDWKKEKLVREL